VQSEAKERIGVRAEPTWIYKRRKGETERRDEALKLGRPLGKSDASPYTGAASRSRSAFPREERHYSFRYRVLHSIVHTRVFEDIHNSGPVARGSVTRQPLRCRVRGRRVVGAAVPAPPHLSFPIVLGFRDMTWTRAQGSGAYVAHEPSSTCSDFQFVKLWLSHCVDGRQ
jgi:hypothetical protein